MDMDLDMGNNKEPAFPVLSWLLSWLLSTAFARLAGLSTFYEALKTQVPDNPVERRLDLLDITT